MGVKVKVRLLYFEKISNKENKIFLIYTENNMNKNIKLKDTGYFLHRGTIIIINI